MSNRLVEPRDSTNCLIALPDKPDIERHSPSILYLFGLYLCYISDTEPAINDWIDFN